MMLHFGLTFVDRALWFLTIFLNFVVIALLLRGRHYKLFPYFTAYNILSAAQSITLVAVRFSNEPNLYFYVYYVGLAFEIILMVSVVIEIAADTFAPYTTIPAKNVVNLLGGAMVAGIFALAISQTFGYHPPVRWWNQVLILGKFSNFLIVGGLGATTYTAYALGLPFFKHNRGLATGLAFFIVTQGILGLVTNPTDHARFHRPFGMLAYIIGQVVWMCTFSDRWVKPTLTIEKLEQMQKDLQEQRLGVSL